HQARSLTGDVYRASDDKWMGTAFDFDYLSRNSTATGGSLFPWDGVLHKGNSSTPAADGTYYVKVTVIKALGNPSNAETWTSPDFVVDRPGP
ncbi:MAG TPA: hypothetical protein VFR32_09595, partial [Gaiellaceae bacterium]|nr:hypothetical protein [Gaiellaceae bacterium]